jgi:hypothetical protein
MSRIASLWRSLLRRLAYRLSLEGRGSTPSARTLQETQISKFFRKLVEIPCEVSVDGMILQTPGDLS